MRSGWRSLLFPTLLGCASSTAPPSYQEVQALFDQRCSGSACHFDDTSKAAGLDLSAGVSYTSIVGVPALQDPARLLVAPGRSGQSYLLCKIQPGCGPILGERMPTEGFLRAEELDLVRRWIDAGAPDLNDAGPPVFAGVAFALPTSTSSIELGWEAAVDDLSPPEQIRYEIYVAASAGAQDFSAPSFTSAPGATSFELSGLAPGEERFFVVRARDLAGNLDTNTAELSTAPLSGNDNQPPSFAGLTSATPDSPSSAVLSWSPATDNEAPAGQIVYQIYQAASTGGQSFASPSFTTQPGATSFSVTGLSPGVTAFFVVRAKDPSGNEDTNTVEQRVTTSSATVSFAAQIQPIFSNGQTCTSGACHDSVAPARGLELTSASKSFSELVNVLSQQCTSTKLVAPGEPDASYLVHKLVGDGPCFTGATMPKADQPLSAAELDLIRTWILEGALNN